MYFGYTKWKLYVSIAISLVFGYLSIIYSSRLGTFLTPFAMVFGFGSEEFIILFIFSFVIVWIIYSLFDKKV